MGRYFGVNAALENLQRDPIHPIHPTLGAENPENRVNRTNRVRPDIDRLEERAAIMEFDGGLSR